MDLPTGPTQAKHLSKRCYDRAETQMPAKVRQALERGKRARSQASQWRPRCPGRHSLSQGGSCSSVLANHYCAGTQAEAGCCFSREIRNLDYSFP